MTGAPVRVDAPTRTGSERRRCNVPGTYSCRYGLRLGPNCNCGVGQAQSLSQVGSDFTTLSGDVYLNSDGSVNVLAVGLTAVVGILVFRNWCHTTRRKGR